MGNAKKISHVEDVVRAFVRSFVCANKSSILYAKKISHVEDVVRAFVRSFVCANKSSILVRL